MPEFPELNNRTLAAINGTRLRPFLAHFRDADGPQLQDLDNVPLDGKLLPTNLHRHLTNKDWEVAQNATLNLLSIINTHPASRAMPSWSKIRSRKLSSDINDVCSLLPQRDFDSDLFKPLLKSALAGRTQDKRFWCLVATIANEYLLTPELEPSPLKKVLSPCCFFVTDEYEKYLGRRLGDEAGVFYVGVSKFHNEIFERVPGLCTAADRAFKRCQKGNNPLFQNGWVGWPTDTYPAAVWRWLIGMTAKFAKFANSPQVRERPLTRPNKEIQSHINEPKLDVGFTSDPTAGRYSFCSRSQILVPGQIRSKPPARAIEPSWLDFAVYAKEIMAAQDNRRFLLSFTLYGSVMRVWQFDRLGGIVSEQFDIHKQGYKFVLTILGFLCMNDKELGLDPTIETIDNKRCIVIKREGQRKEFIVLKELVKQDRNIEGRATKCWVGHPKTNPKKKLIVKDVWENGRIYGPFGSPEGSTVEQMTQSGIVNVVQYYHRYVVRIGNQDDDVLKCIRRNLSNWVSSNGCRIEVVYGADRSRPISLMSARTIPRNRAHHRIIFCNVGTPIYKPRSCESLISTIKCCIQGHKSLLEAGYLHRNISLSNLMIDIKDKSQGFLIDLELAGPTGRDFVQRLEDYRIGTREFVSIGLLENEKSGNTFMDDLESFFWVLF